jgi:hypothetical protein
MPDDKLIGFMVMVAGGEHLKGLGFQKFLIAPRVGEFVTLNDEAGIGQAYKVVAVMHPLEPVGGSAGDLILKHVGTDLEVRMAF